MRCIYCRAGLGRSVLLPEYHIGKRLAYDPANAHVWSVCGRCGGWNLAPLDRHQRQGAVATLERFYAATPSRGSSFAIGIAEVKGKSRIIRVGSAAWPEFAAWRYGQRLVTRSRRAKVLLFGAALFTLFMVTPSGWALFETEIGTAFALALLFYISRPTPWSVIFHVRTEDGRRMPVRWRQAYQTRVSADPSGGWRLLVEHDGGAASLRGHEAIKALRAVMSQLNSGGGKRAEVLEAIEIIQRAGGSEKAFDAYLAPLVADGASHALTFPKPVALALEIAANEETERRALQGELAGLSIDSHEAAITAKVADELTG